MRFAALLSFLALASAQPALPSVNQVLLAFALSQREVKDFQTRIAGSATLSGQSVQLDLTVWRIAELELSRVEFNQPQSLAGNVVISEKGTTKNYFSLTNQVVVTRGQAQRLNIGQITDFRSTLANNQNNLKVMASEEVANLGKALVLEATPSNGPFAKVKFWLLENGWKPYRIQTLDAEGAVVSDLTLIEYKTNVGMTAQSLRALPADAEVVNR
jgi:outer membrane lipoprotein-sorting protein